MTPAEQGEEGPEEIIRAAVDRAQLAEDLAYAQWDRYRAAGMPYGETDEGMLRWAQELLRRIAPDEEQEG